MKNTPVAVVGLGQGYQNFLKPALIALEDLGELELVATVDVTPNNDSKHIIREQNEALSQTLSVLQTKPIVFLEHDVHWHTPDAIDLVNNGYKVIIEKPYAVTQNELSTLRELMTKHKNKMSLMEYYTSMKIAPLRLAMGDIKETSFYFTNPDTLVVENSENEDLQQFVGKFQEHVGDIQSVEVLVLEGEGMAGHVRGRGSHVVDSRIGGGMINDLGLHAYGPLLSLQKWIGSIDPGFEGARVRVARCDEYLKYAKEELGLDLEYIGESYCEVHHHTEQGIPYSIAIGKYTPFESNKRHVKIVGDKGVLIADMNDCYVQFSDKSIVRAPKTKEKYITVVRSALEELEGTPSFQEPTVSEVGLLGQELVFSTIKHAKTHASQDIRYRSGKHYLDIFSS